ncbi:hypothetical protein chiPu_0016011 [Chiloscyllium punctatum]|uniref:Uncharacterized protein n=1 Tax=Chiloscyllium punctatum TaxID=137246 RepID=A0A401T4G3_CHIPU|nr:hypothetical protein [Chiloscyllium punctatum]
MIEWQRRLDGLNGPPQLVHPAVIRNQADHALRATAQAHGTRPEHAQCDAHGADTPRARRSLRLHRRIVVDDDLQVELSSRVSYQDVTESLDSSKYEYLQVWNFVLKRFVVFGCDRRHQRRGGFAVGKLTPNVTYGSDRVA